MARLLDTEGGWSATSPASTPRPSKFVIYECPECKRRTPVDPSFEQKFAMSCSQNHKTRVEHKTVLMKKVTP